MGLSYQMKSNIKPTNKVLAKVQKQELSNTKVTEFHIEHIDLPPEFGGYAQRQIINLIQRLLVGDPIRLVAPNSAQYLKVAKVLVEQILQQQKEHRRSYAQYK
jgi:hypothetical protein